jgi:hypothetical protein
MDKSQKRQSRAICLDNWEKQIIYGALLGNAFIVDPPKGLHCYLVIRQSKKQDTAGFQYKAAELRAFARQSPVYSDNHDYRWTSISHQDFDFVRDFCYKNKKKNVTMEWLNQLRDVSLMIWYLDRGFYKDGRFGLNTANLKNAQSVICQFFNEVYMPCKLDGNKIVFDEKGRDKFLKTIAIRVPKPLLYRLEEFKPEVDNEHEKAI